MTDTDKLYLEFNGLRQEINGLVEMAYNKAFYLDGEQRKQLLEEAVSLAQMTNEVSIEFAQLGYGVKGAE